MLFLLAPLRSLPVIPLLLILAGVGLTLYTATSNALVQLATSSHLQGRVMGLYSYIFLGTAIPGALLAGWLSQISGTTLAFTVAGGGAVSMAAAGLVWYVGQGRKAMNAGD